MYFEPCSRSAFGLGALYFRGWCRVFISVGGHSAGYRAENVVIVFELRGIPKNRIFFSYTAKGLIYINFAEIHI